MKMKMQEKKKKKRRLSYKKGRCKVVAMYR